MSGMHRDRMKASGRIQKIRIIIQLCSAVLCNGYLAGFKRGRIFTGKSKAFCVPVIRIT